MAAEEQERVANEEAEKRLKAALAAKRDPSIAAQSRIASPVVGDTCSSDTPAATDSKPTTQEVKPSEDVVMENGDSQASAVSPAPEVRIASNVSTCWHAPLLTLLVFFQSPWIPEIKALFDDVKKIAPKAAYDIIGSVPGWISKYAHNSLISV